MNLQDELNIPLDDFEYEELESFLLVTLPFVLLLLDYWPLARLN